MDDCVAAKQAVPHSDAATTHIVVMGVSGVGKSTIAQAIVDQLGWAFAEGDEFHPKPNLDKMSAGSPLADEDRLPWLEALAAWTRERDAAGEPTVLSCSALRRSYRDVLAAGLPGTVFVHLVGDMAMLLTRMSGRTHFMPSDLLESQPDALEPLEPDERGVAVDVRPPHRQVADDVLAALRFA